MMTITPTLQRLTSSAIHGAGLLFFAAEILWLPNITNPLHKGFGGSYQFLTINALMISTVTFGVGLLADAFLSKKLSALKNILSICATPLDLLVSILYWTSRAIDKKLVVPRGHEVPFIPDFGFHAMPAIMLTLDVLLLSPPWPIKACSAMLVDLVLTLLYWGWVEYCFSHNGWYPYPGLTPLSTWRKLLFCIIVAALMAGITMSLKWVGGRINGVEERKRSDLEPVKRD